MTRFARAERAALSDTFLIVGPDAPTLCEGWTTADLATHLVVRDGRPDLAVGPMLPLVGDLAKSRVRAIKHQPWPDLVEQVRSGPPIYSLTRVGLLDEMVNLVEFYTHHEDVLRAVPQSERRVIPEAEQRALWTALDRMAKLMFRRSSVGVELISPLGRIAAKRATPRGSVAIEGAPGELLLASYGRHVQAQIDARGSGDSVEALWSSRLGIV